MKQTDKYWENVTDPTHKETLAERKKKRRKYLWKTENARALDIIGIVFSGAGMLGLFSGQSVVARLFPFGQIPSRLLDCALCVLAVFLGFIIREYSSERSQQIPYIPPVNYRVADLPADEVLVRASDQQVASPEELLRAAHNGQVVSAQVLLRPEESGRE